MVAISSALAAGTAIYNGYKWLKNNKTANGLMNKLGSRFERTINNKMEDGFLKDIALTANEGILGKEQAQPGTQVQASSAKSASSRELVPGASSGGHNPNSGVIPPTVSSAAESRLFVPDQLESVARNLLKQTGLKTSKKFRQKLRRRAPQHAA